MKTRRFNLLSAMLLLGVLCLGFASCGKDDDNDDNPQGDGSGWVDDGDGNDDGGDGNGGVNIGALISRHVNASVSYADYVWKISCTSTMEDVLPDCRIKYGVEFGEGDYYYQSYMEQSYSGRWSVEISIFIDDGACTLYLSSYNALNEKMKTEELTDDEKELYREIVKLMDESEAKILRTYMGRVFVEINGKRYYILEYDDSDI